MIRDHVPQVEGTNLTIEVPNERTMIKQKHIGRANCKTEKQMQRKNQEFP